MQVPWKLKSLAFSVFDRIGTAPLYFAQKHLTRRSQIGFREIRPFWKFHFANLKEHGSKTVFEFGAGKTLAQNLYVSQLGISQTLVDLNPMLDLELVNGAIDRLRCLGVETHGHVSTLDELYEKYRIRYIAPGDARATGLGSDVFDACISTNTLEHIPPSDIAAIWKEMFRILRPSGIISSKIDYADHYAHTDKSISLVNFLRYTEEEWHRHNHDCHYQNRLRHQAQLQLLRDAGFRIEAERAEDPVMPPQSLRILPQNLTGSETDYCVSGYVLAQKPD